MAFGIDDIALAAVEAGAETAEVGAEVGAEAASEIAPEAANLTDMSEVNLDKEFSPEAFEDKPQNDVADETNVQPEIESVDKTYTFEEQTIDNFKLEDMRPQIESDLNLGCEHSSGVLRENMSVVMEEVPPSDVSNPHHLVGNDTPIAAQKLEQFGIDRNDPANGIFLPNSEKSPLEGAVHGQGRHLRSYSNEVEQRFLTVSSREEALEVLQSLKEDLYSGNLQVH